uniref:Protein MEMO1 n=1 Tax=Eutreptiella gymnastica TaxID=73025 RepID=A0A7S1N4D9_9EUGL
MSVRTASHSGSWYTNNPVQLEAQVDGWLRAAKPPPHARIRALISPHAGLSYSGRTASYAYSHVQLDGVKRIFILGPSHHEYLPGIAVSPFQKWACPLGELHVDTAMLQELQAQSTPQLPIMAFGKSADEEEHSLEMQIPFIAQLLRTSSGAVRTDIGIVPIVVGSLSGQQEVEYGQLLAPYLQDPANLFCISSDFCHWGTRFRYTHYDPRCGQIHESIEVLDKEGMALIQAQDYAGWVQYLQTTKNTICGRVPISLLLTAMQAMNNPFEVKWVQYAQSQAITSKSESSVSYAAGVVFA